MRGIMKIGIVTLIYATKFDNYGGTLQNYALSQVLSDMGHEVSTIALYYSKEPFCLYEKLGVNYIVNMVLMFALVKKAYNVLKLKSTRKKEMIIFCNSDQKKFIRILDGSRKIILEIWIRNMIFI